MNRIGQSNLKITWNGRETEEGEEENQVWKGFNRTTMIDGAV